MVEGLHGGSERRNIKIASERKCEAIRERMAGAGYHAALQRVGDVWPYGHCGGNTQGRPGGNRDPLERS